MPKPVRGARIKAKFKRLEPKIAKSKKNKGVKPRKKNYLATLVITVALWITLAALIYFTTPNTPGIIYLFFAMLIPTLLLTFSVILANTRRGLLATILIILFLILRLLGIGHVINLILLCALAITAEIYFTKNS